MDPEETKSDAAVKPAKTRAPRKSTRKAAPAADGDAGAAASTPKTTKPRTRRKKEKPATETPAPAAPAAVVETPAAPAPTPQPEPAPQPKETPAPAPQPKETLTPAPAPQQPAQPQDVPAPAAEQEKVFDDRNRRQQPPINVRHARKKNQNNQNRPQQQQLQQPTAIQPQDVTFPLEDDISEPSSDFRQPDYVPGFAVPEIVGGNEGGNNSNSRRNKRRRNRNRNNNDQNSNQTQQNNPRVDPDELCRRAWKIFLGEVTEDGLALMDDRTAQEASRRAFKVAEIFLLEAARHRPAPARPMEQNRPEESPEDEEMFELDDSL